MAGEDAPDFAGILQLRLANFKIIQRNSLTVEHSKNVVIGLYEECCRIRERKVLSKPFRPRVPVSTDDGQCSHVLIKCLGYLSGAGFGGKQTIWVDQHDSDSTFSRCIGVPAIDSLRSMPSIRAHHAGMCNSTI